MFKLSILLFRAKIGLYGCSRDDRFPGKIIFEQFTAVCKYLLFCDCADFSPKPTRFWDPPGNYAISTDATVAEERELLSYETLN